MSYEWSNRKDDETKLFSEEFLIFGERWILFGQLLCGKTSMRPIYSENVCL